MTDLFGHEQTEAPVGGTRARVGESPIVRMRGKFGNGPEGATCGGCAHLVCVRGYRKNYHKCGLYRISQSEASDFRKKWLACGRFVAD